MSPFPEAQQAMFEEESNEHTFYLGKCMNESSPICFKLCEDEQFLSSWTKQYTIFRSEEKNQESFVLLSQSAVYLVS
jgi:hypothetical protein